MSHPRFLFLFSLKYFAITMSDEIATSKRICAARLCKFFIKATFSTTSNMNTLYDDLMSLCAVDDTFYYKDIRFQGVSYRIFNYRLCSYAAFQSRPAAMNCRGTMFNLMGPKNVKLVSLPPEKFFNYEEGFGRKQFHEQGRFGDKMEKMDGTLISTFLHSTVSKEQVLRIKSKQSLTSKQVLEAMPLLVGM